MTSRLTGWQCLWLVAVLVWGVIVYAQTDWPHRPLINMPVGEALYAFHAEWDARTRRVILNRAGYWLITSAGLYAIGHGIAWSWRGVSSDINHLR
jgi:hypothetical protein